MNSHQTKNKILAISLPAIAMGVIVALLANGSVLTQAMPAMQNPTAGIATKTPEQLFNEGLMPHYVKSTINPSIVEVKRGSTITVPITIEHMSKGSGESVTLTNFHNIVRNFPPSSTAGLTAEEFDEKIQQGTPIPGEISVDNFFSVSPSTVTIPPNSSTTLNLKITIPASVSDEMLGKTLNFGIVFDTGLPHQSTIFKGIGLTVRVIQ